MKLSPDECASSILETVPLIMRRIRTEMRSYRDASLSIPQFRALLYIQRQPGASLSQVANHLGLTPATTSRLIQAMVVKKIINRQVGETNRRKVQLSLTSNGESMLIATLKKTRESITESIHSLSEQELNNIQRAMFILGKIFSPH